MMAKLTKASAHGTIPASISNQMRNLVSGDQRATISGRGKQRGAGMRWVLAGIVALAAGPAAAEDWRMLTGPEITQALAARLVVYETGARQDFMAGGLTTYEKQGSVSSGAWRVEGDRYCSQWPPRDAWACYDVAVSADGLDVRFTGAGTDVSVGRYGDLE